MRQSAGKCERAANVCTCARCWVGDSKLALAKVQAAHLQKCKTRTGEHEETSLLPVAFLEQLQIAFEHDQTTFVVDFELRAERGHERANQGKKKTTESRRAEGERQRGSAKRKRSNVAA